MAILMKVGYRNLIPFGVVLSHDGCDLSIRNVILSAGRKRFCSHPIKAALEGETVRKLI